MISVCFVMLLCTVLLFLYCITIVASYCACLQLSLMCLTSRKHCASARGLSLRTNGLFRTNSLLFLQQHSCYTIITVIIHRWLMACFLLVKGVVAVVAAAAAA
jgi:hypothetical protein